MNRGGLTAGQYVMVSQYWTDGGAQFYPLGRIYFDQSKFHNNLNSWNVYYVGGPPGREMIIAHVR